MKKQKHNLHALQVRIPLHLLNKIERAAITKDKTVSHVVRAMIEKS